MTKKNDFRFVERRLAGLEFIEQQAELARLRREERAEFYQTTRDVITKVVTPTDPASLAALIVKAAARARGEIPHKPTFSDSDAGRLARRIVQAAKKARGEE